MAVFSTFIPWQATIGQWNKNELLSRPLLLSDRLGWKQ